MLLSYTLLLAIIGGVSSSIQHLFSMDSTKLSSTLRLLKKDDDEATDITTMLDSTASEAKQTTSTTTFTTTTTPPETTTAEVAAIGTPMDPVESASELTSTTDFMDVYADTKYTVSLKVFLLDLVMLMNNEQVGIFEVTALKFIAINLDLIVGIGDVEVTDQRLTWLRQDNGESSTGLDVSFQAKVTVPSEDVSKVKVEQSMQELFDTEADAFLNSLKLALVDDEEPLDDESKPDFFMQLDPIRVTLGISAAIVGCFTFLLIILVSIGCMSKKETDADDGKDLSKTSIVEEDIEKAASPIPITPEPKIVDFPIQQIMKTNEKSFVDSDEDLTFDNTLDEALPFSKGIAKAQKDQSNVFECNESAILANINNATDSSDTEGEEDDDKYEYSLGPTPKAAGKKTLTMEDLIEFDNMVRRAEC